MQSDQRIKSSWKKNEVFVCRIYFYAIASNLMQETVDQKKTRSMHNKILVDCSVIDSIVLVI